MPLVDSHCHLQDAKFEVDRPEVIRRSLDDLDWLVVIGDDLPTSRGAMALCQPRVYAAVGIHPYYASTVNDDSIEEIRGMARSKSVVALGEMGLDYFKYNETPRDVQKRGFIRQLELAAELDLPVVIHNRDSDEDLASILDEHCKALPGGVMHCFGSEPAYVERCLAWGFHISFAGNVTFPKAQPLRDAAKAVPLDRILVETDAPYLAPQPVRGKRCEPAYVRHTATLLAEFMGIPPEEFMRRTAENAAALFRIADDSRYDLSR